MRRYWYRRKVANNEAAAWLRAPLPSPRQDYRDLELIAVDLEMTGLDSRRDAIISVGWVEIQAGVIELASARYYRLKPPNSVGHSATIHQLRDVDLTDAAPLPDILQKLLRACQGKVLVFHNAALDMGFLNKAFREHFAMPLLAPVVDTLMLEKAKFERRDKAIVPGALRLAACRSRYNLPAYPAHNALVDAVATAELLLAQLSAQA